MSKKETAEEFSTEAQNVIMLVLMLFIFGVPQRTISRFFPSTFNANYAGQTFGVRKLDDDLILLQEQRDYVPSLNGRWFYKKDLPPDLYRQDIYIKMTSGKDSSFTYWSKN